MKKGKGLLSIFILIAVFFAGYYAGQKGIGWQEKKTEIKADSNKTRSIEETIADFESAYNTGDFEKVLSCMSVSRSKLLSSVLSFLGKGASSLLGIELSQGIMNTIWSLGAQSSQMTLTIRDIVYTGTTTADVILTVTYIEGAELYREMGVDGLPAKMNMVLDNGDWKIASDFIPVES